MRKFALLLFIGGMFASCSDGDLTFNELNFTGNVQKCNEKSIFYKLNGNEMLLLNMTGRIDKNNPLPLNQEFEMVTGSGNILYRQYSDKAISGSICDIITPAYPQVISEYTVNNGGLVKYKRIRKIEQKPDDSRVSINYVYTFDFQNIILTNGDKELKYENYYFGEYSNASTTLDFNLGNILNRCENTDLVFNKDRQVFKIIGSDIQFTPAVGSQTINLNNTEYIKFYLLNLVINSNEACDLNFSNPETTILEEWTSNQGILEVNTTANTTVENPEVVTGYTQTFILKNAIFTNGIDSFTITEQVLSTNNINL